MATLIVDDESDTRQALRLLLSQSGHKTILEAKHGAEALQVIDREGSRIRTIVADWEMPYLDGLELARRISVLPELELTAFLLISSDLSRSRLKRLRLEIPRLDGYLIKPFERQSLRDALDHSHACRASFRNQLGFLGNEHSPLGKTLSELLSQPLKTLHWKSLQFFSEPPELLENHSALGAVLIDPHPFNEEMESALSRIKKYSWAPSLSWVCLGRKQQEVRLLKTQCQIFVDPPSELSGWLSLLETIGARQISNWQVELRIQEAKNLVQAQDWKAAKKVFQDILKIDPTRSEIYAELAEVEEALGEVSEAIENYRRSLQINPCRPKPYLQLLKVLKSDKKTLVAILQDAVAFCPRHPGIQQEAEKITEFLKFLDY